MRKRLAGSVFVFTAIAACAGALAGDATVRVVVNGQETRLSPPGILRGGKAYIGLRSIAAVLGASTTWDKKTRTAAVTVGNKRTRIAETKGITVNGVLYLPLRTTGEAVGCTVEWDSDLRAVTVTSEAPCPRGGG